MFELTVVLNIILDFPYSR